MYLKISDDSLINGKRYFREIPKELFVVILVVFVEFNANTFNYISLLLLGSCCPPHPEIAENLTCSGKLIRFFKTFSHQEDRCN